MLMLSQVRVFPGKTFAFVNYLAISTAAMAQQALDNTHVPAIAGAMQKILPFLCIYFRQIF